MKKLFVVSSLSVLILCTSCASIFTGAKRNVLFESNPSGAKVYVNGFEKGTTPTQIKVKADDHINFKLDGYKERVVIMDSKFNLVAILNGISIIGWGIDALTGSLKRVDTQYVKVDLESTTKDAVSVTEYLEKGKIQKVNINTKDKVIETVLILN
ncbi:PEGA domain-containing protein [Flavobacteriaceae bacterium 144Ye]|uniref:PEGA domain-containing protein n=1 Tax=unclassified Gaetbulibacter TaxID=2625143 RepID=UPI00101B7EDB|nr:PEGA domain-containing protein [Gaetbulibacter sp. NE]RYH72166.1 PEGA domain-containing protein [Flavobacteriaceae bacterium 144Ye]